MTKVIRSEMRGYEHIRSQFFNQENRDLMNRKLLVFTIFFSMMAIENTFRITDFLLEWSFPIPYVRDEGLDFHSSMEISGRARARVPKLTQRQDEAPGALIQCQLCLWLMVINNLVWINRSKFSTFWHTLHYFVAASLLVLYIPRHDWYKVMQGPKFGYTNMNIFIYQIVLGTIAGLTSTHHFIALLGTMTYQVIYVKLWYDVKLLPICMWDGYLHMVLPTFMMVVLGYLGTKQRLRKDQKMANEFSDIKKVLGSMTQGVALTVNFAESVR